MNKKIIIPLFGFVIGTIIIGFFINSKFLFPETNDVQMEVNLPKKTTEKIEKTIQKDTSKLNPMAIESLRKREYVGGDFVMEEKLPDTKNYEQYIVSYKSEGLKIYGLLTIPLQKKSEKGLPTVIFIHGYIPPKEYSTTGNYPTYQARLANSGFITFKPDLRGHGNSEGTAVNAHYSEKYVVDTLYAIAYLKNYKDVDPEKIVYWGHSNGGQIGLRVITISKDLKAASFWAGVVGSYQDMFETYNHKIGFLRTVNQNSLIIENALPSQNPTFWQKLDPYNYLNDVNIPVQLQHGTKDDSVPIELSLSLKSKLDELKKSVEYFEYLGDDHNLSKNVNIAFKRTIDFYNNALQNTTQDKITAPINNASKRITKKPFGLKVSPENSPIKPEKFSGYHSGTDFEIFPGEENSEIEILAICNGPLIMKNNVRGYGGLIIQKCDLNAKTVTVIYGHLNLESVLKRLNEDLKQGEKIGILGQGFSQETALERKHLHLGIYNSADINLLGYVENSADLAKWIDYQTLIVKD